MRGPRLDRARKRGKNRRVAGFGRLFVGTDQVCAQLLERLNSGRNGDPQRIDGSAEDRNRGDRAQ